MRPLIALALISMFKLSCLCSSPILSPEFNDTDTVVARQHFAEAKILFDSMEYEEALNTAKMAERIYSQSLERDMRLSEVWSFIGKCYLQTSNPNGADLDSVEFYTAKSFRLLKELKLTKDIRYADDLYQFGHLFGKKGKKIDPVQSKKKFREALVLYRNILAPDDLRLAKALAGMAEPILNWGTEDALATRYYEESLKVFYRYEEDYAFEIAEIHQNLGAAMRKKGNPSGALDHYYKALEHYGEEEDKTYGVLNNIGNLYFEREELQKAASFFVQSINVLDKDTTQRDALKYIIPYNNLGAVYLKNGQYDLAIQYLKKSLALCKENDKWGLTPDLTANIGMIYFEYGEIYKALEFFEEAVKVSEKYKYPKFKTAFIFHLIGDCYFDIGEIEKAFYYHNEALLIFESIPPGPSLENKGKLLATYGNIAKSYYEVENYKEAISLNRKALSCVDEKNPLTYFPTSNLGLIYSKTDEFELALEHFEKSVEIFMNAYGPKHPNLAEIYINIADLYIEKKEFIKGLGYNDLALLNLNYSESNDGDITFSNILLVNALVQRGRLFEQLPSRNGSLENLIEANSNYLSATDALFSLYNSLENKNSKYHLVSSNYTIFENAIRTSNDLYERTDDKKYFNQAFAANEQSKALFMRENLFKGGIRTTLNIPDTLLYREKELQNQIGHWKKNIIELPNIAQSPKEIDSLTNVFEGKIFELKWSLDSLRNTFKTLESKYYDLKFNNETLSLADIQSGLLDNGQAIVEYFVGDSSVYIFTILQNDFKLVERKLDFDLGTLVKKMKESIKVKDIEKYSTSSFELSRLLFLPIQEFIPPSSYNRIIVVPDGLLWYVPFDALLMSAPKNDLHHKTLHYAIHDYSFSYVPSITALKKIKDKVVNPNKPLLAFAPFAENRTVAENTRFSTLIYSGIAANEFQNMFGGDVFKGIEASKDRLMNIAHEYQIIHFGTHAEMNDHSNDHSFIALSGMAGDEREALLYNWEIFGLDLNAELVVLSACSTGLGEMQRGEGLMSLGRGFSFAGAKSLLTSLWKVSDKETAILTESFYRNIENGDSKDIALRKAKRDFITGKNGKDAPFYWAAFVPFGDMEPLSVHQSYMDTWLVPFVLFLSILGGLLFFRFRKNKDL